MGCDITLYIEYDKDSTDPFSKSKFIRILSDGEFGIRRDYRLFSALAGVRSEGKKKPKFPPRGFPKISSNDLINQFYYYVLDEGEKADFDDEMTKEEAEHFVTQGLSHYRDLPAKKRGLVSEPNAHTPSWLLFPEILEALVYHGISKKDLHYKTQLVLDILELTENKLGNNCTRIVFWFNC